MEVEGSKVTPQELNYKKYSIAHSWYNYVLQPPRLTDAKTLTPTGAAPDTYIDIPAESFINLSRSRIEFVSTPAAGGNLNYNWVYRDGTPEIKHIQLITGRQVALGDIPETNKYTKMTLRRKTKLEDMLTWDKKTGIYEGLFPSTGLATDDHRPDNSFRLSLTEAEYLQVGAVNLPTPVTTSCYYLSTFKDTLLSVDKTLYFKEQTTLRISWAPSTDIVFTSTSATNPTTGVLPYTGNIALSNIACYLAVETNTEVCAALKAAVESENGFSLIIPWVVGEMQPKTATTKQSLITNYDQNMGRSVLEVFSAPFDASGAPNLVYSSDCNNDSKIIQFHTSVNSVQTQPGDYDTSNGDEYKIRWYDLRGSSIQSKNEFYYNYVYSDSWRERIPLYKAPMPVPEENILDGYKLETRSMTYGLVATTANVPLNWWIYAVLQRTMIMKAEGITVV